ncbi:hypothetical protein [Allokutzneria sp. NRRL B-24872]|uniref:hypothetical protein n=1 Tax=Allokutzneria sp. NRRL B-24872 TaxID=1137961 RepID=UPI000A36481B|nr:hypothetical protein [Allokutzneria sp. NRRL B-24872]
MTARDLVKREQLPTLQPITQPVALPPPARVWTAEEMRVIGLGRAAGHMDERWLALVEADRLFLHRSWTGYGVYEAVFVERPEGWQITEAWVESDTDRYRRQNDAYETLFLEMLVMGKLLGGGERGDWERLKKLRTPRP